MTNYSLCLLELRSRIEQLEADTYKWRMDHLRLLNAVADLAPDRVQFFLQFHYEGDVND